MGKIFCSLRHNVQCFSNLIKIAQFYISVIARCVNVERIFFVMQTQTLKKNKS